VLNATIEFGTQRYWYKMSHAHIVTCNFEFGTQCHRYTHDVTGTQC